MVFFSFLKKRAEKRLPFAVETKLKPSHPVTPYQTDGFPDALTFKLAYPADASPAINTHSLHPGHSKMRMNIAPRTDTAHVMIQTSIEGGRRHRIWIFLLCRYAGVCGGQPKNCSWGMAYHLVLWDKVSHSTLSLLIGVGLLENSLLTLWTLVSFSNSARHTRAPLRCAFPIPLSFLGEPMKKESTSRSIWNQVLRDNT